MIEFLFPLPELSGWELLRERRRLMIDVAFWLVFMLIAPMQDFRDFVALTGSLLGTSHLFYCFRVRGYQTTD